MVQRGEALLVRHIRHTSGIYGFFAGLVRAAGRQPEYELCWWRRGRCANDGIRWESTGITSGLMAWQPIAWGHLLLSGCALFHSSAVKI